jgi:hypothetical protein
MKVSPERFNQTINDFQKSIDNKNLWVRDDLTVRKKANRFVRVLSLILRIIGVDCYKHYRVHNVARQFFVFAQQNMDHLTVDNAKLLSKTLDWLKKRTGKKYETSVEIIKSAINGLLYEKNITKPAEPADTDAEPIETQPADTDAEPSETQPADPGAEPNETQPADTDAEPSETQPADPGAEPNETQPADPAEPGAGTDKNNVENPNSPQGDCGPPPIPTPRPDEGYGAWKKTGESADPEPTEPANTFENNENIPPPPPPIVIPIFVTPPNPALLKPTPKKVPVKKDLTEAQKTKQNLKVVPKGETAQEPPKIEDTVPLAGQVAHKMHLLKEKEEKHDPGFEDNKGDDAWRTYDDDQMKKELDKYQANFQGLDNQPKPDPTGDNVDDQGLDNQPKPDPTGDNVDGLLNSPGAAAIWATPEELAALKKQVLGENFDNGAQKLDNIFKANASDSLVNGSLTASFLANQEWDSVE